MKFVSSLCSFLLAAALSVHAENSPEFTLQFYAPAISTLSNFNIVLSESLFSVKDVGQAVRGYIDQSGALIVNQQVVGAGRGYLTTTPQSSAWEVSTPWTVSQGILELHCNSTFFAVPEGKTAGSYVLSAAEKAEVRGITKMNIKPVLDDGTVLQTWPRVSVSTAPSKWMVDIRFVLAPLVAIVMISMGVLGVSHFRPRSKQQTVATESQWQPIDEKALFEQDIEQNAAVTERYTEA